MGLHGSYTVRLVIMSVTISDVGDALSKGTGRQCIETARTTGQRCENSPAEGSPYCGAHGDKGQRRKKAVAYKATDSFAALYDPDSPPIQDPVAELQRLGGIARNALNVAGQKVNELKNWQSVDAKGTAQLKVEIQLWTYLINRSESILTTLAKLGIDERRVQIQEREQQIIVTALRAIMADPELALSPIQRQAWESVVPRHLAAILASAEST